MISKSKLGAIAFIAAIGLTSPAFAANPPNYGPRFYAPSQSGGGSAGYNRELETYRLRHRAHHPAHRASTPQ
jgi:hypothetical protein